MKDSPKGFVEGPLREFLNPTRLPGEALVTMVYQPTHGFKVGDLLSFDIAQRRPWWLQWLGFFRGPPPTVRKVMRVAASTIYLDDGSEITLQ